MHQWIDALDSVHSAIFFDELEKVQTDNKPIDLLVIDHLLLDKKYPLSFLCRSVNKVFVVGENLTPHQQIQFIYQGACGYSNLSIDKQLIKRAIKSVINNEIWLQRQLIPMVIKEIVDNNNLSRTREEFNEETKKLLAILTHREIEVVELVYNGLDYATISNTLHITTRTVKAHLSAIFRKLGVQDRFQLIILLKNLHVGNISNSTASIFNTDHTD